MTVCACAECKCYDHYHLNHISTEEQFHRFLTLSNERIARHRIKMITLLDRYFAKPEVNTSTV